MKKALLSLAFAAFSNLAFGAQIDPATVDLPWMNGPARDSRYRLADEANVNKVHVWEALSISCSWCARNAPQVAALANEYVADERVQFLDLCLDSDDRSCQQWIARHNPPYPLVKDVGRKVWNALTQQNGIPQTFVTACDGTMKGFTIGYWDASSKQRLRDAIAQAKQVSCVE